jgi:hypothetical protein
VSTISIFKLRALPFDIEINLDISRSVESTRGLMPPSVERFVFAVASVSLRVDGDARLVCSETETGNALEMLKRFLGMARRPPSEPGIEELIRVGELSRWFSSYWRRIDEETSSAQDEQIYETLSRCCLLLDHDGCIAVYRYSGAAILEVCGQSVPALPRLAMHCAFDADALSEDILAVHEAISAAVVARLNAH